MKIKVVGLQDESGLRQLTDLLSHQEATSDVTLNDQLGPSVSMPIKAAETTAKPPDSHNQDYGTKSIGYDRQHDSRNVVVRKARDQRR